MARWAIRLLYVVALGGMVAAAAQIHFFELMNATVRKPGIAVWLLTPVVSPGDRARLEVAVFGGARAALRRIAVRGEGIDHEQGGLGKDWSIVITAKTAEVGEARDELEVPLPLTLRPGSHRLEILALSTEAEVDGHTFVDVDRDHTIELLLDVVPIGEKPAVRTRHALAALAALVVAVVLMTLLWLGARRLLSASDSADPSGKTREELGVALMMLAFAGFFWLGMAGITFFMRPLGAATGITSDWLGVVALPLWIAAPVWVARRVGRSVRSD